MALLVLAGAAWAQFKPAQPTPPPAPGGEASQHSTPPTFSVKVNLVRLLTSVRDREGAIMTSLNRDDFQVIDNGIPQDIAVFERNTSVPLSVSILIDTSGSTRGDLHYEVDSVTKFLHALVRDGNRSDTFALYSFNWQVRMETEYGRNAHRAETALRGLRGEGGTSLYDAVYLASDELATRSGRHVMVVVTDGGDTTSYKRFADAQRSAQLADAVIYPIVVVPIPNDAGRNMGGEHALDTLAASTGGRIFYPAGFDQLDQAFDDILRELRTQYLLGFYPKGSLQKSRQYHRIQILMQDKGLRVAARSGYYEP
ncbi:MAG: VWA domain-containing protein [Bryobacteraceae bacterium]